MAEPKSNYASLQEWIHAEAVPFSLAESESLDAAVDRLIILAGEIELLGLGEPTHGCEAFLHLRNRLFYRLVEEHGYSAIAIESSFPRGMVADDYINGGNATWDEISESGFSHGFGKSAANRELVEWMRSYSAKRKNSPKLSFYGFDSPTEMMYSDSPRQLLLYVLDYLARVDGVSVHAGLRERIESLLGDDAPWQNQAANYDPAKSIGDSEPAAALRREAEELIHLLETRSAELLAKSDDRSLIAAQQHAAGAKMLLVYHAKVAQPSGNRIAELLGLRDQTMAMNLEYIQRRERGRGKVFVHAHNSHLQRGKASWQWGPNLLEWWAAGSHVAALFDERYFVVGAGVASAKSLNLSEPETGTLEQLLASAPGPVRLIPTHMSEGLPHDQIAQLPLRISTNPGYFPFSHESLRQFDALVLLDNAEMA